MLCYKYMTLYYASLFEQNKLFAETADCLDWNNVKNVIASDIINHVI